MIIFLIGNILFCSTNLIFVPLNTFSKNKSLAYLAPIEHGTLYFDICPQNLARIKHTRTLEVVE